MTIHGVPIDDRARHVMLIAALAVEYRLARRLTTPEIDFLILAVVERLADGHARAKAIAGEGQSHAVH